MPIFKTLSCAFTLLIILGGTAFADASCTYQPRGATATTVNVPGARALNHGINLSDWWQDDQSRALTSAEIQQLHDNGFDFVRLPISPTWLQIQDPDQQKEKLDALRCDIVSALNEGLAIVLDLHAPTSFQVAINRDPNEAVPRIEDMWRKMQPLLADLPPGRVFIGIYNEPLIETDLWWKIQERIIQDLRQYYPDNTFIVASGPFDGWWQVVNKKPYKDLNLIYDFHFYDPMAFTHHGAEWLKPEERSSSPIAYPVTNNFTFDMDDPVIKKYVEGNWNREAIFKIINQIVAWKDYYSVNAACLEFGVYRPYVDDQSRYNWLRDVRDALENGHIPWAMWEYRGPFGLLNKQGSYDSNVTKALVLKPNRMP